MTESAFNFNQAPSTGGARQFGKLAAIGKTAKAVFGGNKNSGGLSAADRAALITHQGQVDIGVHAIKSAMAEGAADKAHERNLKVSSLTRKQETKMAKLKHSQAEEAASNAQQRQHETMDYSSRVLKDHAGPRQFNSISLGNGVSANFGDAPKASEENG